MRFLRIVALLVSGLVLVGIAGAVGVSLGAARELAPRPVPSFAPLAMAGASVVHGRHVAESSGGCLHCHGASLDGATIYADSGMGTLAATNLTRGAGGIGAHESDNDYVLAIRYGMRPDGSGLILMPSIAFSNMSDDDLRDVIAYIRSMPPVDSVTPKRALGPMGTVLIATGKLPVQPDLIGTGIHPVAVAPRGVTLDHGAYLAHVAGCLECHGADLGGGHYEGSPSQPAASNITRGAIGSWSEADFARTLRTGRDPRGHLLDRFMPWIAFGRLNDEEMAALWTYLRSVPAVKT